MDEGGGDPEGEVVGVLFLILVGVLMVVACIWGSM